MNANELADELEVIFTTYSDEATFEQAANMLRQQQAEIEALKGKQEPVAWMRRMDGRILRITPEKIRETDEPLYTSPQYRELSDDEIENIAFNFVHEDDELDIVGFAKAILERAKK